MPERNRKRKRDEKISQQIDLTKEEEDEKPKQKKRKVPKRSSIKKVIHDSSKQDCASTSNTTTNLSNEKMECSICYENLKEQGILDCCAHIFCFACIHRWSNSSNTCPICKQRFKSIEKKQIEDSKDSKKKKKKPTKVRVPTRNFRPDDEYYDDDEAFMDIIHDMVQDVFRSVVGIRRIVPHFGIPRLHLNLGTTLPPNPNEPIEISDDENEEVDEEEEEEEDEYGYHQDFISDLFEFHNAMDIRNFTPGFVSPFMRQELLSGRYRHPHSLPQPIQPPHHPMYTPPMMQRMNMPRFNFVDMTPREMQRQRPTNPRMLPQMNSQMMSRMPPMVPQYPQMQMPQQVPHLQRVPQIPQIPQIPQMHRQVQPTMHHHQHVNTQNMPQFNRNVNTQNFVQQQPFTSNMNNQPNNFTPPFPDFNQLFEMFNNRDERRTSVPINDVLNNLNQFK